MDKLEEAIGTIQDMLDVMEKTGSAYVYSHNGGQERLRNVLKQLKNLGFNGDANMEFMSQCINCLCRDCLENYNENPNGCCYTCCKDSGECEPISQCPFGWYHVN